MTLIRRKKNSAVNFKDSLPSRGHHPRPAAGWVVCSTSILLFLVSAPCGGETRALENRPRVLFMEHPGSNPSDDALFTAIRAQMSVASLTLKRIAPTAPADLESSASHLATAHHAALVFWIEDGKPCQIHFFVPDDAGGQFSSRTIDIDVSNQSSRYDAIAVVAAIMIESLIVSQSPEPAVSRREREPAPVVEQGPTEGKRRWLEIHLAYAGSFVATGMLSHGGTLGVGFFPVRRFFVAVSIGLYAPLAFSNEALRIELTSRQLEVDAAARLFMSPFEIRLGISYSADFRSFSTTALETTIRPRAAGTGGIHSIVPFLFAAWTYRERIGVFGKMGASLAINETVYRIRRVNGEPTEELEPFDVKLVYQFGLLVQL